jgi:hypothetical protein
MTSCHYVIVNVNSSFLEFTSKLKQQEKQEKLKNCQDLGKTRIKIQEASEDLQQGGIMFPSSEASYLKTKT